MVALVMAFIVWLSHRGWAHLLKRPGAHFGPWCGLRRSQLSWPLLMGIWVGAGALALLFQLLATALSEDFARLSASTPQHQLAEQGLVIALVGGLAYAVVQTGFSEELLFRGVLARRLMNRIGFWPGNVVQAGLFGALHVAIVVAAVPDAGPVLPTLLGVWSGGLAGVSGWVNERLDHGSIVGSWGMHAAANFFTVLAILGGVVGG